MKIGILGTGMVGRAHAARLASKGHAVMVGTRDPASTMVRSETDYVGNPPFSVWLEEHPEVALGSFAEAASFGQMMINATLGSAALEALGLAGAAKPDGQGSDRHLQSSRFLEGHATDALRVQYRFAG